MFLCFNGLSTGEKINIIGPIERSSSHVDSAYKGRFEYKIYVAKIVQEHLKLK